MSPVSYTHLDVYKRQAIPSAGLAFPGFASRPAACPSDGVRIPCVGTFSLLSLIHISSIILGPISTCVFGMTNNATGSGMGTCGLVGQIMAFQTMTGDGMGAGPALFQIILMHVIAPAVLALLFSELMRKKGWIKPGDMKLDI